MHFTWEWDENYVFVSISYNFKHPWPINMNLLQFIIVCLGGGNTSFSVILLPILQDLYDFSAL